MDTPAKRAGRPPKQGAAQTPAQRQAAYRARLVLNQHDAMLKPGIATTAALLASIKHHCTSIDIAPDHADIARRLVAPVIRELCDRYKIKLA
jgi:hypothetical protein